MTANASAYSILGLPPGADRQAVENAYRELIKRYHPDREGGDGERAAEINRAYFELRSRSPQEHQRDDRAPVDIAEAIYMRRANRTRTKRKRRHSWMPRRLWKPLLLLAIVAAGCACWPQLRGFAERTAMEVDQAMRPPVSFGPIPGAMEGPSALAQPLDEQAIAQSIAEARRMIKRGSAENLADSIRECQRNLREAPSASQLDRCAAFDFAVLALSRNDPLRDEGPFSASAVTSREMSAARLLSDDFLMIDSRLDQVRARVEAAITPPEPPQVQTVLTDLQERRPD